MINSIQRRLLHLISHKSYSVTPQYAEEYFQRGFADTQKFFGRFGNRLDSSIEHKTFLDVGCGYGTTCIYLAQRGAEHVTGVETRQPLVEFANKKLSEEYPYLKDRVRFFLVGDLGDEKFDVAISKDSFEHYEDPAGVLKAIHGWLNEGGELYLGFAPLWKSPFGGHMDIVTSFPWAHLIFSERVLLEERRLLTGENVTSYADISGGLNQMTLGRFRTIVAESDFFPVFLKTNVSERGIVKVFNCLKHIPFCEEYFTVNVYTILQKRSSS